jgi:hypothetical protein
MTSQNQAPMELSDLFDNLTQLDGDLLANYGLDQHFDITIVGSGPMILMGVLSPNRRTTDIDVLEAPAEVLSILDTYNMNTMVATFLYSYPETWRERKQKLEFEGDSLSIYTMSLEDLVILKLLAFRERDQEDLLDVICSKKLDWEKLDSLIKDPLELRVNMSTKEYWEEFLGRYCWLLDKRQGYE